MNELHFNQQGMGWWSETYLKMWSGKIVLGQVKISRNEQRKKSMEAKWAA